MKRAVLAAIAALLWALALPARADDASAATLFTAGNFDAAATQYAAVLAANPRDAAASLALGTLRLYQNDLLAAQPLLQAALAANPSDTRAMGRTNELQRRIAESKRRATVDGGETSIPFVASNPLPAIRIRVNGKDATFMIDTGGSFVLEPDFAKSLGLATQAAGNGVFAGGKTAAMERTTVARVELGGARADDVDAIVLPTHASDLYAGTLHVDGIVGTTLFERFLATIDYPGARLILRPRSPEASKSFEAAAATAGATIEPCWLVGDHFVMADASVNAAPPGLFLFDSGLAGGGISPSERLIAAANITLDRAHAGTGMGGGGAVTAIPFVVSRIAVGSAVVRDVRGLYTPEGSPLSIFPFTVWGVISNDYLEHFAYTVDFDAMKIVLAPARANT